MESSGSRLAYLLKGYREKTLTAEESDELRSLLQEGSDDALTDLLQAEWRNASEIRGEFFEPVQSARMLDKILSEKRKRERSAQPRGKVIPFAFPRLAAAAAVLICLLLGVYLNFPEPTWKEQSVAPSQLLDDALPGTNKATLTIASGKTIVLDDAPNGLLAEQGTTKVTKDQDGQVVYGVGDVDAPQNIELNTLTTPRGGQYQIVLPDGTHVWLNSASSITFPAAFTGNERRIALTGEAYFEVAKNPNMPFRVTYGSATVEVLGTHFNIMAYEDESEMRATLLEGSVKVTGGGVSHLLEPGEQAASNRMGEMRLVGAVNVDQVVAWKNGLFDFKDTDLPTILRAAARWYDLEISYEGEIPDKHFTGRISRNINASELLSILEYTGVEFRIHEKKIIVIN